MKKPKIDLAELDQESAIIRDLWVPHIASIFRGLYAQEGLTRAEALTLTVAYIKSQSRAE